MTSQNSPFKRRDKTEPNKSRPKGETDGYKGGIHHPPSTLYNILQAKG